MFSLLGALSTVAILLPHDVYGMHIIYIHHLHVKDKAPTHCNTNLCTPRRVAAGPPRPGRRLGRRPGGRAVNAPVDRVSDLKTPKEAQLGKPCRNGLETPVETRTAVGTSGGSDEEPSEEPGEEPVEDWLRAGRETGREAVYHRPPPCRRTGFGLSI